MKKLIFAVALFVTAHTFGQAISSLPLATGKGNGSTLLGIQNGVTKRFLVDSIAKISKNYADSLKILTDALANSKQSVLVSGTNLTTINGYPLNVPGNLVVSAASTKPLYKELTPVVDTVTWNYDSSSTANLLTTRTLNLKISGTIPIGSAGVIVVKQGTTGGDSLKYLGTYLGIGKIANKTSLVGFIKNATGFVFSVDTLSNYIASAIEAVSSYDASAQTLFTAAGTTGNNYKVAVDSAIRQLKRINLAAGGTAWSKSLMINGRAGGTLSEQSYNWKDPTIYNYTYNGGIVYNPNGTKFDGVDDYIDMGFIPSAAFTGTTSDVSIVSVVGQNSIRTTTAQYIYGIVGNAGGGGNIYAVINRISGTTYYSSTNDNIIEVANANAVGRYISGFSSSTIANLYKNGVQLAAETGGVNTAFAIGNFVEGGVKFGADVVLYTDARIDVTQIINSKLTPSEAAAIDAVWAAYETALSR